jgi:hypothetical protein
MSGLASLQQDKLFLAARQLPGLPSPLFHCLRHYRRQTGTPGDAALVGVPLWLQMATRNTPQLPSRENWSVEEEAGPAGGHCGAGCQCDRSDEILGRFHDQTISAWVEYEGVASVRACGAARSVCPERAGVAAGRCADLPAAGNRHHGVSKVRSDRYIQPGTAGLFVGRVYQPSQTGIAMPTFCCPLRDDFHGGLASRQAITLTTQPHLPVARAVWGGLGKVLSRRHV